MSTNVNQLAVFNNEVCGSGSQRSNNNQLIEALCNHNLWTHYVTPMCIHSSFNSTIQHLGLDKVCNNIIYIIIGKFNLLF